MSHKWSQFESLFFCFSFSTLFVYLFSAWNRLFRMSSNYRHTRSAVDLQSPAICYYDRWNFFGEMKEKLRNSKSLTFKVISKIHSRRLTRMYTSLRDEGTRWKKKGERFQKSYSWKLIAQGKDHSTFGFLIKLSLGNY